MKPIKNLAFWTEMIKINLNTFVTLHELMLQTDQCITCIAPDVIETRQSSWNVKKQIFKLNKSLCTSWTLN